MAEATAHPPTAPMPPQQLAEIRARVADLDSVRVAADSMWKSSPIDGKSVLPPQKNFVVEDVSETPRFAIRSSVAVFADKTLAECVAASRQDMPALLAEVDRLTAQVAAVRALATAHEYRWLHELLDGPGTHGGAL